MSIFLSGGTFKKPAGGAYVGPLDLEPGAIFAYSQRAMAASFTDPVIRISTDEAGTNASDFSPTSSNAVDAAAVLTFLNGNPGIVQKYYNQSTGSPNPSLDKNSVPAWSANSGRPATVFNGAADALSVDAAVSMGAGARTFGIVYDYVEGGDGDMFIRISSGTDIIRIQNYWNVQTDLAIMVAGPGGEAWWASSSLMTTGLYLIWVVIAANGTVTASLNGVDAGMSLVDGVMENTPAFSDATLSIHQNNGQAPKFYEVVGWQSVTTAAQQNMMDYYGL